MEAIRIVLDVRDGTYIEYGEEYVYTRIEGTGEDDGECYIAEYKTPVDVFSVDEDCINLDRPSRIYRYSDEEIITNYKLFK